MARGGRDPRLWLVAYAAILTAIALWPVPVDSEAQGFLRWVESVVPAATYGRVEFAANIALFVPLGFLLTLLLPTARHLVLPVCFLVTVAIEVTQALALDRRTPSVLDVIANTAGACVGIVIASLVSRHGADADRAHTSRK